MALFYVGYAQKRSRPSRPVPGCRAKNSLRGQMMSRPPSALIRTSGRSGVKVKKSSGLIRASRSAGRSVDQVGKREELQMYDHSFWSKGGGPFRRTGNAPEETRRGRP
jgi:hypothetical protein